MKAYDDAAYQFYRASQLKCLPLNSWDIYGLYFDTLCGNYEDIVSLRRLSKDNNWDYRSPFKDALLKKNYIILVTDTDSKIVHATHNIAQMNGYRPEEVLGKSPKLFQGPETNLKTTGKIRKAIDNKVPFEAVIRNYRKDGTTYNCWLKGEPVFDTGGKLVNFIAYEKEVA
ncbi:MAG: PAS domain-containing protein [Pricia sp.]